MALQSTLYGHEPVTVNGESRKSQKNMAKNTANLAKVAKITATNRRQITGP